MTEHFIRCQKCGLPHDRSATVCENCRSPITPPHTAHPPASKQSPTSAPGRTDARKVGFLIDGKYRLKAKLGSGAMATVFEAEHVALGRGVAIKMLHESSLRSRGAVLRFIREARLASSIGHPNICEVYDIGDLPDGSPYMVMELLRGRSLAERIAAQGRLPAPDAIQVVTEVLAALQAAHGAGVIHRDIKPENIYLARRNTGPCMVKLLDFGILKPSQDRSSLTRAGTVMGTPFYMAPEQARGDKIDMRVDLWAAGAVLYEALTGRRPFQGNSYFELMQSILLRPARNPLELRSDLPPGFLPILDRALEKEPGARYPDAQTFLRDLEALRRHAGLWDGQVDVLPPGMSVPAPAPPPVEEDYEPESAHITVDIEYGSGTQAAAPAPARHDLPVFNEGEDDDNAATIVEPRDSFR